MSLSATSTLRVSVQGQYGNPDFQALFLGDGSPSCNAALDGILKSVVWKMKICDSECVVRAVNTIISAQVISTSLTHDEPTAHALQSDESSKSSNASSRTAQHVVGMDLLLSTDIRITWSQIQCAISNGGSLDAGAVRPCDACVSTLLGNIQVLKMTVTVGIERSPGHVKSSEITEEIAQNAMVDREDVAEASSLQHNRKRRRDADGEGQSPSALDSALSERIATSACPGYSKENFAFDVLASSDVYVVVK